MKLRNYYARADSRLSNLLHLHALGRSLSSVAAPILLYWCPHSKFLPTFRCRKQVRVNEENGKGWNVYPQLARES
jgi:hypothetical protein